MGFGPAEIDTWEPYQIIAVYRAWQQAHAPKKVKAPSKEQFYAAISGLVH